MAQKKCDIGNTHPEKSVTSVTLDPEKSVTFATLSTFENQEITQKPTPKTLPMDNSDLLRIPLFHLLSEDELNGLINSDPAIKEMYFEKGDILAMQDTHCNRLIIITEGRVKAEMIDETGRVIKVEEIVAPSTLAILFLFGSDNRFPVQVTALEDVSTIVIPQMSVLRMLRGNETVLRNYLNISTDFAARLSRRLSMLALHSIRKKLAVYLRDMSRRQNSDTITIDRTKSKLADHFGVARTSLERELAAMQRDGLITSDKKIIAILKPQEIKRIALS
jgi:CRP-like cAMP-binding protein